MLPPPDLSVCLRQIHIRGEGSLAPPSQIAQTCPKVGLLRIFPNYLDCCWSHPPKGCTTGFGTDHGWADWSDVRRGRFARVFLSFELPRSGGFRKTWMHANPGGCPTNQHMKRTLEFHLNENPKEFFVFEGVCRRSGEKWKYIFFFFHFFFIIRLPLF